MKLNRRQRWNRGFWIRRSRLGSRAGYWCWSMARSVSRSGSGYRSRSER